jgi:hypothetical protein
MLTYHAEMDILVCLQTNRLSVFSPILIKVGICIHNLTKRFNVKFHENPFGPFRVVTLGLGVIGVARGYILRVFISNALKMEQR